TFYYDLKDVKIYDSNKNGFVVCKKILKNPNKNNWLRVKLSNGRVLTLTEDHPLPVKDKGRVFVKDLMLSDEIPVIYNQYNEEEKTYKGVISPYVDAFVLCNGNYTSGVYITFGTDETEVLLKLQKELSENALNNYTSGVRITFGIDETEVLLKLQKELSTLNIPHKYKTRKRGKKGTYYEFHILCPKGRRLGQEYNTLFEGKNKTDRHIPNEIFSCKKEDKLSFMAGLIDADGYIRKTTNGGFEIKLGNKNHELALGEMNLMQALDNPAKISINYYKGKKNSDKIRWVIRSAYLNELTAYLALSKKKTNEKSCALKIKDFSKVISIEKVTINDDSFDVETESDRFDVSGVNSHNCRTRVIGNINGEETSYGRGNLSFTSINLPRLGIKAKDVEEFFILLEEKLELVSNQLLHRFEIQASKKVKNMPFLMGQNVWMDSDKLKWNDEIKEVIKHGTLSIGFIGLSETLVSLTGKHHGESKYSQKLGLKIIKFMRAFTDKKTTKTGLNFSLLATPAEGLSNRFTKIDKKLFGEIEGVTDREYYTNSFHVPVYYDITTSKKIKLEAPYHELTNAGHISYVELDGDPLKNLSAFERVIRAMKEQGIGYGSINHPVDRDPVCGHTGVIDNECPNCGRAESLGQPFERIRRITGYLVGGLDKWNDGKRAEEKDRVKHS
ncbi:MAG: anaerobic ribonucleoside-triphosphate reductase, partial [Endomicrobium sp.]|nr:anaerobic ribonucleoside-triphosphate reductase [Endomicrobium sp.]